MSKITHKPPEARQETWSPLFFLELRGANPDDSFGLGLMSSKTVRHVVEATSSWYFGMAFSAS